jgi:predicted GIY-YIG superfamily endonuclease
LPSAKFSFDETWREEACEADASSKYFGEALVEPKIQRRATMYIVYILQSINEPERFYTGLTTNLSKRLDEHNSGKSIHTNKFKPWKVRTYTVFDNQHKADNFETYLKSSSGRAFMKKRF